MKIITINTGSSSVKVSCQFCEKGSVWQCLWSEGFKGSALENSESVFKLIGSESGKRIDGIVHRIVHGGTVFSAPTEISEETIAALDQTLTLAPLHNPPAINLLKKTRARFAEIRQFVVFDTGYFEHLPQLASAYALPSELVEEFAIRRYGFHGLAHQSLYDQLCLAQDVKGPVITMQLGSGCSIAVVDNGCPVEVSMGFSPLEGLMMATRSGDIDPGLLLWLEQSKGLSAEDLLDILNNKSGLLGVSSRSSRVEDLLTSDDEAAKFALELYCYRMKKYLGSYLTLFGRPAAIVFGGGVGENCWQLREKVLKDLQWLGIVINSAENREVSNLPREIGDKQSKVAVWVFSVDEELVMAKNLSSLL